jgi:hypothetical protein
LTKRRLHRAAEQNWTDDVRPGLDGGGHWRASLPEGRGPSPLLIVGEAGRGTLILPHPRRPGGRTDAEQVYLDQLLAELTSLAEAGELPADGVAWITSEGPVPVKADPDWIARWRFDRASVAIRLPVAARAALAKAQEDAAPLALA